MTKKFVVEIECENSAFEGTDLLIEVERLLQVVAKRIRHDGVDALPLPLIDLNGNVCGEARLGEWRNIVYLNDEPKKIKKKPKRQGGNPFEEKNAPH